jgi:phosphomevalonate kinase
VRVIAPGKLVLTGAYAVLRGAPAIVVAVDRHAVADGERVDSTALYDEQGRKLGLGSSAASLVASLGARAAANGEDLGDPIVRSRIFRAARVEHTRAQGGGSGVDVAASVHGGALRYAIDAAHVSSSSPSGGDAAVRAVDLPAGVVFAAYFSGTSARTSDLRARVDALVAASPRALSRLEAVASSAASAVERGAAAEFVEAARDYGVGLDALGHAADAPIVSEACRKLGLLAAVEGAAFLPSGAGGGDVAVWIGRAPPSPAFAARAASLAMRPLELCIDPAGVRLES